jgi:UDP-3-O-[3-hydroxymyristoyl] N-acetylglucosamine deacetylase
VPAVNPGDVEVRVQGVGLHTGAPCTVVLRATPGPVRLRSGAREAAVAELSVASTARATTVEACGGALRVGTVEHVFAALAGLGVRDGVTLDVDGPEMPLLDGGASAWCRALGRLALRPSAPRLQVTRFATYDVGPSLYELAPADAVHVTARIDFDDPRLVPHATWQGDPADFEERIAPARTFALAREVDELARRGLARHVDPASVLVLSADGMLHAGRPPMPDEPARHKLLDLLGDLYLHGGPPLGRVHALRPGHAPNARVFRRALEDGVLAPL